MPAFLRFPCMWFPKSADLQGVEMMYGRGDEIDVVIDRDGLAGDAGIGHLDDDTMVVIAGAAGRIGESVHATVVALDTTRLGTSVVARAQT